VNPTSVAPSIYSFTWRDDGEGIFGPYRGWDAVVDLGGDSFHFSQLAGETDWYCDAHFGRNGYPYFCHGFGSRVCLKQIATDEIAVLLNARLEAGS
jgi:hypothetical protein